MAKEQGMLDIDQTLHFQRPYEGLDAARAYITGGDQLNVTVKNSGDHSTDSNTPNIKHVHQRRPFFLSPPLVASTYTTAHFLSTPDILAQTLLSSPFRLGC